MEKQIKDEILEKANQEKIDEEYRLESNKFWREWWISTAMANGKGIV